MINENTWGRAKYASLLEQYKETLDKFVGPTEVFICGDTLQVEDYSKYNWTMFDPESKQKRHDETFEDYLARAYELGKKFTARKK